MSAQPGPTLTGRIPSVDHGRIGTQLPDRPIPRNPVDYDKFKVLMRSRKFWTTVIAATVSTYLYAAGELSAESFASTAALVAGIYVGSVAIEDGLRNLINLWTE